MNPSKRFGVSSMRQLSDIIRNQNPLTLDACITVKRACEKMRDHKVGAVLVTGDDGQLVGIFTGRDLVRRVAAAGKSTLKTLLKDVMTPNPVTMSPEKTALDALRLMWDGGFRHVPLLDKGVLVGIVSRGDIKGAEADRFEEEREVWEHMR